MDHKGDAALAAECGGGRRRCHRVPDALSRARNRGGAYELAERAARRGIIFLSTPFSREAADFLETLGVPAFETRDQASSAADLPLQARIARKGKPMIVSTGMSTPEEIDATVRVKMSPARITR